MRSQNVRGHVASNRKRTIDLMDLKPYFHGTASRSGAPFCFGSGLPYIPIARKANSFVASSIVSPSLYGHGYHALRRRTKKAFGFAVNLHRFRHAAASFWSIRDPMNVRGAKDLLGQATFGITEKHYIMGQSRLAGRALAHAVNTARK